MDLDNKFSQIDWPEMNEFCDWLCTEEEEQSSVEPGLVAGQIERTNALVEDVRLKNFLTNVSLQIQHAVVTGTKLVTQAFIPGIISSSMMKKTSRYNMALPCF